MSISKGPFCSQTALCLWRLGKPAGQACPYCDNNYWSRTDCGPQLFFNKPPDPPTPLPLPPVPSLSPVLPQWDSLLSSKVGCGVVELVERINTGLTIPPPCRVFIDCWVQEKAHLHGGCGLPLWWTSLLGYAPQHVFDSVGECCEAYNHKQVG